MWLRRSKHLFGNMSSVKVIQGEPFAQHVMISPDVADVTHRERKSNKGSGAGSSPFASVQARA
jgi:hypothetical protein